MGGKDFRRGRGRMTSEGMEEEMEEVEGECRVAGIFFEAAVEGLTSWWGEGSRFMETDWMAEASSLAGLCDMLGDG